MIDLRQVTDTYRVGREKPGGKVYVLGPNDVHIASYSGLTRTLEWYVPVTPEDAALIAEYLEHNF